MALNNPIIADTNFISHYLKGDQFAKLKMEAIISSGFLITTTSISSAELFYGAIKKGWKKNKFKILQQFLNAIGIIPFTYQHSLKYAQVHNETQKMGFEIGFADAAIASICLIQKIPLLTENTKDFEIIKELVLFD